jgi:hypothetical protein
VIEKDKKEEEEDVVEKENSHNEDSPVLSISRYDPLMWCDPPSIPSADAYQSEQLTSQDTQQLSFIYQPGVGLYDQKTTDIDQDLRMKHSSADVDERMQVLFCSSLHFYVYVHTNDFNRIFV